MSPPDLGAIDIRCDDPLVAGALTTIAFDYTVGAAGLAEGGRLRVGLPHVGWGRPEVGQYYFWSAFASGKDRRYTQYDRVNTTVRLETNTGAVALLETEPRFRKPWTFPPSWLRDYDRWWLTVTLEDAGLDPGDRIIITYGDPQQKPLTARVQRFPEAKLCFLAFADARADGDFKEVGGSPWMTSVRAGEASHIDVVCPSIVLPGQTPQAHVAYTDAVRAAPENAPEVDRLDLGVDGKTSLRRVDVCRKTDAVRIDTPELASPREGNESLRITIHDPRRGLAATGNPALTRAEGPQLFFGDLHGQSQYHSWNPEEEVGISCNTPIECLRYARDIAGLDFCALTDTHSITKEIWAEEVDAAQRMNEPGRFIAFQGSEVGDDVNGHRNLIFAGDDPEPGIRAVTPTEKGDGVTEVRTPEMQKRYARRDDCILIPHHTKMWLDWDCYDPGLEPVAEIYSIWGSGERSGTDMWILREMTGGVQEALARGYRIGFIGGSDTHAGMPGRSFAESDRDDFMIFKAGYAAVWADELTRRGIMKALRARRCYATTGARMILETFIEDQPMGAEIPWPDSSRPRVLRIDVWGTEDVDTVTLVKNNADVHVFKPRDAEAHLTWEDKEQAGNGDYYYVRVIQRDGNRAWSSPMWLELQRRGPS